MASLVAKYAAKKMGKTAQDRFGQEDPYYETVPVRTDDGRPLKKVKRQPKAFPPGISEHDQGVLVKARRRAYILDYGINLCGIRFGMSSLIGMIPVVGDFLDLYMAVMVVRTCKAIEEGLPPSIVSKMYQNIFIDFLVGLVPVLGDIADALYRCNTRNVVLLERHLKVKGKETLDAWGTGRPANISAVPGSVVNTAATAPRRTGGTVNAAPPTRPEPAVTRKSRGWFPFGGRPAAQDDIERNASGLR